MGTLWWDILLKLKVTDLVIPLKYLQGICCLLHVTLLHFCGCYFKIIFKIMHWKKVLQQLSCLLKSLSFYKITIVIITFHSTPPVESLQNHVRPNTLYIIECILIRCILILIPTIIQWGRVCPGQPDIFHLETDLKSEACKIFSRKFFFIILRHVDPLLDWNEPVRG